MTKIYRGTSASWVDEYVRGRAPKMFEPNGGGEFGAGCYFWLEDLPAAIMTALQYNANERDWGVVELEYQDTDLQRLGRREAGYGSRVLEFKHERQSSFVDKPGNFVVPKDYSHIAPNRADQGTHTPAKTTPPPPGSFGKMQSEQFRAINAAPAKYGLDGTKNSLVWQYDLVIGLCAADYTEKQLVQMKFANHGMTFINDVALCPRKKIITGKKVVKAWKKIEAWKMADRKKLFEQYFKDEDKVDLDAILG